MQENPEDEITMEVFSSMVDLKRYKEQRLQELQNPVVEPRPFREIQVVPLASLAKLDKEFYADVNRIPAPALFQHYAGGYEGYCKRHLDYLRAEREAKKT